MPPCSRVREDPGQNKARMKLPLLLTLLVGAVSTLHLRTETPDFNSKALPQDGEVLQPEAEEGPAEELLPLEEEEEGGSGSEDDPEEEEAVESDSALDVVDKDLQCPKEEDTVKLEGSPECKTCRRYLLVRTAKKFNKAQLVCRKCYRGTLISIHSFSFNYRIQCSLRGLNQGQVWIGGRIVGRGRCKSFRWVDGSSWNFAYWAAAQPKLRRGRCVALCTRGGNWRTAHCAKRLPFVCSY